MAVISLTALNAVQSEGTGGGAKAFTFTIKRVGDTSAAADVGWQVAGAAGTGLQAASGADFDGGSFPSGTASMAAGVSEAIVTVLVASDSAVEYNEGFTVSIGSVPEGDTIGTGSAQGVILSDDTSFSIGEPPTPLSEGTGSGSTAFTFMVFRAGAASVSQSVDWAVTGDAQPGTVAASAADFDGGTLPTGTVTFAPGESQKLITVLVRADSNIELNEGFAVTLSNATAGASVGRATAHSAILNDDGPRYSIGTSTFLQVEGTGSSSIFTFTVSRSTSSLGTDTLGWSVTGGGLAGTVAANHADFVGGVLPSGTVSFAPGVNSQTITVAVEGDSIRELNESFTVSLNNPSANATIGRGSATVGIIDDDTLLVNGSGDTVQGTEGNDYFLISAGAHTVVGLGGADKFVFAGVGGGSTVLADFNAAQGDKIDLSKIDAIAGTLENDAFTFVTGGFTGTAGQLLGFESSPGVQLVAGDFDGDANPDFVIVTLSADQAQANWFVL